MTQPDRGYRPAMAANDAACVQHVWVQVVVGEGRGRLDIASTCSLCGALNDETGPSAAGNARRAW